ncbi:hypothetical protein ACFX11_018908 [Malus domestica]
MHGLSSTISATATLDVRTSPSFIAEEKNAIRISSARGLCRPLHVRPTSVLYGADWGFVDPNDSVSSSSKLQQKLKDDFDTFTTIKATDLVQPLVEA